MSDQMFMVTVQLDILALYINLQSICCEIDSGNSIAILSLYK